MNKEQKFVCPYCKNELTFLQGSYACSSCGFSIPDAICRHSLTDDDVSNILAQGYSNQIDDFYSRYGQMFKGRLLLNNKKVIVIEKCSDHEICAECGSDDTYRYDNLIWCGSCHCVKNKDAEPAGDISSEQTCNYDIFISHSSLDDRRSLEIYDFLTRSGFKCWIDKRSINPGIVYSEEIAEGLINSRLFLAIISASANESRPILDEVIAAYNEHKTIIVYNIDQNINVRNIKPGFKIPLGSPQWINDFGPADHAQAQELLLLSVQRALYNNNITADEKTNVSGATSIKPDSVLFGGLKILMKSALTAVLFFALSLVAYHCYFNFTLTEIPEETDSGNIAKPASSLASNRVKHAGKSRAVLKSKADKGNLEIGSVMKFGSYWDYPLNWIYAFDDRDGNQVFISKDIITFKPFDVAHSNLYGRIANGFIIEMLPTNKDTVKSFSESLSNDDWIRAYGENNWEFSTIRAWLNSRRISVEYPSVRPNQNNTNFYSESSIKYGLAYTQKIDEPGFLTGFTAQEIEALRPNRTSFVLTEYHKNEATSGDRVFNYFEEFDPETVQYKKTLMPKVRPFIFNFQDVYTKEVEDLVYLPSLSEFIKISQDPRIDLNYSKEVYTTKGESYILPNTQWWLRTPCGFLYTTVCTVEGSDLNKGKAILRIATSSDLIGIRPLLKLRVKDLKLSGSGTESDPYQLKKQRIEE